MFHDEFKSGFVREVERQVNENGKSYMQTILDLCEHYDIQPELTSELITPRMKSHLRREGADLHLLPMHSEVPVDDNS